ncbi:MAG: hypothetical protein EXQ55_04895 [Acidobacteria bacterium]|nr:hypothetical protein [Acidobacteriota bacterium]
MSTDLKPGVLASAALGLLLLAFAVSVDFPKAAGGGFKGDEATYYVLGQSLARDFDFTFTHDDLARVWEEFPGPEGIFLKRGKAVDLRGSNQFPFVRWVKTEDPERNTRLYFSKSYIYPLAAAPFVVLFGTSGFLVLHALLISLDLFVAYLFLNARLKASWVALPLAAVFLVASVVPVYVVWLLPELFNFSLALSALFFWVYKEVAGERLRAARSTFLLGQQSDVLASALIGVLIFSKPTHAPLLFPLVALAASRRQWRRAITSLVVCAALACLLFGGNVAITGEFNYQGGDRKTFYHYTGFPFANSWETFETIGPVRGREDVMVGDVLANTHSLSVLRHNLFYFVVGRYAGLVPYFFPGVLAALLFVVSRQPQRWQWMVMATAIGAILMHVTLWPFTWNGGGGPVGSRYFLSFYPLFLFLIPAGAGLSTALAGLLVGGLFTAQIVLNPFYASAHPGDHAKSGPLRRLPIELTLINDLPVAQNADRMKMPLGGSPPVLAYFPDDNAYNPEGEWFWVKGKSTAEIVLRAAVANAGPDRWISKVITGLTVEIRNGGALNRVTISTGDGSQTLEMTPGEMQRITLKVEAGVPYRRDVQPTSYLYTMSVRTTNGFVPFLDIPCEQPGTCASDSRYLGAMIHVIPEYTDAETTIWSAPADAMTPGGNETGGLRVAP